MNSLHAVDFFCGIGGLTRGLLDAGVNVAAGIDSDESCSETYTFNNQSSEFHASDIRKVDQTIIQRAVKQAGRSNMIFTGCAPCQSFSKQRKSATRRPDATVLGAFAELVESYLPGYVVIENVPGLRNVKGFSTYKRFKRMLTENKYGFSEAVVNANSYGVPQSRRRLILIAARRKQATIPKGSHGGGVQFESVRGAISHYPRIAAGKAHNTVANHVAAELSDLNLKRLKCTPKDGGDRRSWPEDLWLECHKNAYSGHTDVYGRMHWDKPAPTLTGRCVSISNGRYGHPTQNRGISLREAAALQSFDDDFIFFGAFRQIALHIGNAVPVLLAEEIGRHLVTLHRGNAEA